MKKIIIIILAVLITGFGGYYGYNKLYKAKQVYAANNVITTEVKAKLGDITKKVTVSGSVQAIKTETITAAYKDTIDEVLVKANQRVSKGDKLISMKYGSGDFYAPYDCIITKVSVESGDAVSSGKEMLTIMESDKLITKVSVDEKDLKSIKLGQKADITLAAYPGVNYTGTITDISEVGNYSNGMTNFDVTITYDDIKDIKVGMTTEVNIITDSRKNVVTIPLEAVSTVKDQKTVLVKGSDGNPVTKTIKTGIGDNSKVEVTEGLAEGDIVLIQRTVNKTTNTNTNSQRSLFQGQGQGGMQSFPQGGMNGGSRNSTKGN
jgi:HlyD family secretion protein